MSIPFYGLPPAELFLLLYSRGSAVVSSSIVNLKSVSAFSRLDSFSNDSTDSLNKDLGGWLLSSIKRQGQHLDNFKFADKSNVFIPEIPSKPRKQWVKLKYLPKKVYN